MHFTWNNTAVKLVGLLPDRYKVPLGGVTVVAIIMVGGFANPESQDNTRANRALSMFGLAVRSAHSRAGAA